MGCSDMRRNHCRHINRAASRPLPVIMSIWKWQADLSANSEDAQTQENMHRYFHRKGESLRKNFKQISFIYKVKMPIEFI